MPIKRLWPSLWAAAFLASVGITLAHAAPLMIVGNDEKLLWDDNGKPIISPAGKDSVLIVDLADPENPKIVANLPLKNSIVGPRVNVAIDPTNLVALVADSIDVTRDGDALKMGPDNKVYVIDLKADPPKLAGMVNVGKQPSGLSFNAAGNLALVTNRADKSVSVGCEGHRHHRHGRHRRARGVHARRKARAGGQVQRPQGVAARRQR
jgi:DNA-binding beta-propeller fold protein YncE